MQFLNNSQFQCCLSPSVLPADRQTDRLTAHILITLMLIQPMPVQLIWKYGSVFCNLSGYWSPSRSLSSGYCTRSSLWTLGFHVRSSHFADRIQGTDSRNWQGSLIYRLIQGNSININIFMLLTLDCITYILFWHSNEWRLGRNLDCCNSVKTSVLCSV